jgi:hypothetical protein
LGNSSFTESQLEDFDQPPARPFIEDYADDTDSDLGYVSGEEEEGNEGLDGDDTLEREPVSARSTRSLHSISRPRSSWDLSDESLPRFDPPAGQDLESTVIDNDSEEEHWPASPLHHRHTRHHNRFGKVIEIEDFAYVTWVDDSHSPIYRSLILCL